MSRVGVVLVAVVLAVVLFAVGTSDCFSSCNNPVIGFVRGWWNGWSGLVSWLGAVLRGSETPGWYNLGYLLGSGMAFHLLWLVVKWYFSPIKKTPPND